ncbi:MAG: hypothetical protein ACRCZI_06010 [Cetobacterium sp.]
MRNRANKRSNSKIHSLNSNSNQFVAVKRSNGNWCDSIENGVRNRFKEHDTTAPAVGLKCGKNQKERSVAKLDLKKPATIAPAVGLKGKGLIDIEVQNVVHGLARLEIEVRVKVNVKGTGPETSERNISIRGPIKDRKEGGARNKPPVRGQGTKTFEDLRVRSSNNTEPNLVTKSKKRSFRRENRSTYRNSQGPLKSNFKAQETRFGAKTDNSKGYRRVQARNSNSRQVESYQALNAKQKERLGRLLEAHLGIGL